MIGDWVYSPTRKPYKLRKSDFVNDDAWFEDCRPIPLTAEILELNEFVKDGYTSLSPDYRYESSGIAIYVNLRTTCDKSITMSIYNCAEVIKEATLGGRNIKTIYVHELQHALRLCGLNELADNFKVE